jgi:hypothetical protein
MKYFYYLRLLFTLIILSAASLLIAQQKKQALYFPQPGNWEHRSAQAVGLDSALLQDAITYAQANESKESRSEFLFRK